MVYGICVYGICVHGICLRLFTCAVSYHIWFGSSFASAHFPYKLETLSSSRGVSCARFLHKEIQDDIVTYCIRLRILFETHAE